MHRISEYGVAAHWRYKESGGSNMPSSSDKSADEKMAWLRQLLDWHRDMRDPHEFVDTVKMDVFLMKSLSLRPKVTSLTCLLAAFPLILPIASIRA